MGSSKTAQALITKFNYEERGMKVWLIKPAIDNRDGRDVIIADECQFFSPEQIDELRRIVDECSIPVLCFGLRTDFLSHLFPGSRRLFEVADSISEIKTICECGSKATVNARLDANMNVVTEGSQVMIGGNESYVAMCHKCWRERIRLQKENQN